MPEPRTTRPRLIAHAVPASDFFAPYAVTLRQLQYLVAVADLGGFGRAAAACHVILNSVDHALVKASLG